MKKRIMLLVLIGLVIITNKISVAAEEIIMPAKTKETSNSALSTEKSKVIQSQDTLATVSPEVRFVEGMKCVNRKEYDEATNIFNKLITEYPDTQYAKDSQIMIVKIQEETEPKPVVEKTQSVPREIPPEMYPDYQFKVGLQYYREKKFEEALVCFQRVVETAPKDSQLANEAKDAIDRIHKRLQPLPPPTPAQELHQAKPLSQERREQIQKEWYERIIQRQQELFDEAMKLKEEGKLEEALATLEKVCDSRQSPIGEMATKEKVKIQMELGLLEQIPQPEEPQKEARELSPDEVPDWVKNHPQRMELIKEKREREKKRLENEKDEK